MVILNDIEQYLILDSCTVAEALRQVTSNKSRIVFVVDGSGVLKGAFSDGDFRNWVLERGQVDLQTEVIVAANRLPRSVAEGSSYDRIRDSFGSGIAILPILDERGRVRKLAHRERPQVRIDDVPVGEGQPAFLIAEIGNNHQGSESFARELVDAAQEAGADCCKFQMRHMSELYGDAAGAAMDQDLGSEYTLDLLSRYQLKPEQLFRVFDYCRAKGVVPLCTPWDHESLRLLEQYGLGAIKLASADLTNHDLIQAAAGIHKPVICSTGMATESEILEANRILRNSGSPAFFLHCNSTYPAPLKDINLLYMERLARVTDTPVGYSGHERGISVALAAAARGACIIEKHFTLDRSLEGVDHKVSLLPSEFSEMVAGIREIEQALGQAGSRTITQGEMLNRETLAKSLYALESIEYGQKITPDLVGVKSPGKGLQPAYRRELLGRPAIRSIQKGDFFFASDLGGGRAEPEEYKFNRPWGVPVRYHDFQNIYKLTRCPLVEFHLSYKDLDLDPLDFVKEDYPAQLVVHSPELFARDHILDLCTGDANYRKRSLEEMRRVIAATERLATRFPETKKPLLVVNPGGATSNGFVHRSMKERMYETLADSLVTLESKVEPIIQTMPPFPWHFGGQRYHNLFVDPEEILEFHNKTGTRICLDTSHSFLACNQFHWSFFEFVETILPLTAHCHLVDARGVDEEGLQIDEGDIDFGALWHQFDALPREVGFIPEIWQGHKNDGEGFWIALGRLQYHYLEHKKNLENH